MEERELERARRRAEREERRRVVEEIKKKEYSKQLEDEARRLREEKQALIAAQKAKKHEEEEQKRKQKLLIAQHREMLQKAAEHRNIQLLRYNGWLPWRRYMSEQRERLRLAEQHYEISVQSHLKQKCLAAWTNFPALIRKQHERERRREQFRGRLRDLVPDFSPPTIIEDLDD
ncbi:hypothetical protein P879_00697 [Paragonimus westermani]|uniref:Uncharacterized protein n=1 Tax=Paragonimus westermani TaxID=34504 RepID=A0A8T0DUF0_9TREM|nr:hypothetical protein P879_00697 [Paragonimus westermani]